MYDAIVIGARCAGSPTAMLLAQKGYRVLLVDKMTFPSDIMSTHYIHPVGIASLKRWGLLDRVKRSNCPPVRRILFDFGSFTLSGATLPTDGVAEAYVPRRKILDKILVDAAVEAGVEFRENFAVQEILMEGDRVVGIRGGSPGDAPVTEKASIVIGADGMRSLLARHVGAPIYHARPTFSCAYYTYWSGVPMQAVELYPRKRCTLIAFPTNDDLVCIAIGWTIDQFPVIRTDVESHYMKTLELAPRLAERVRQGKQEERFVGSGDIPNFFRKPYGPGWALVGDAGYHKDPVLGHGISDAFRDAELLADAIDAGMSGRQPLESALADYERQRNEIALPIYEINSQFASQEPPSAEMRLLFQALRTNQSETERFFAALEGTISPAEFFAPENMAHIISSAGLQLPQENQQAPA
ncbi:MAG: NAD(P)/FAD-dependent oxidoreductase [Ktedonobacteraceae bacterium]|nr:NAD(P)/FAD-dependent oxidoreductase [Ktedonobacteraceae bacterium]